MTHRVLTTASRSGVLIIAAGFMMAPNCAALFKGCGKAASTGGSSYKTIKLPASYGAYRTNSGVGGGAHLGDDLLRASDDSLALNTSKSLDDGIGIKVAEEAATQGVEVGIDMALDSDGDFEEIELPELADLPDGLDVRVAGRVSIVGGYTQDGARQVLGRHIDSVRRCYAAAKTFYATPSATIRLIVNVRRDGTVRRTRARSVRVKDTNLLTCLERQAKSWTTFPTSADGRGAKLTYRLQLAR